MGFVSGILILYILATASYSIAAPAPDTAAQSDPTYGSFGASKQAYGLHRHRDRT